MEASIATELPPMSELFCFTGNPLKIIPVKQCHKPSPNHHHSYMWYKLTVPSHGWFVTLFKPHFRKPIWNCDWMMMWNTNGQRIIWIIKDDSLKMGWYYTITFKIIHIIIIISSIFFFGVLPYFWWNLGVNPARKFGPLRQRAWEPTLKTQGISPAKLGGFHGISPRKNRWFIGTIVDVMVL